MIEREEQEQAFPHSRIFEIHFPWKFNPVRRNRIIEEIMDLKFINHRQLHDLEHVEGDTYWGWVAFDEERTLDTVPQRGRLNRLVKSFKVRTLGLSVAEVSEINALRSEHAGTSRS